MTVGKRQIRLAALLLTVIFCCFFSSVNLFHHEHEVGGSRLVHSHPHGGDHSHSGTHIKTIAIVSFYAALAFFFAVILTPGPAARVIHFAEKTCGVAVPFSLHEENRGPPC